MAITRIGEIHGEASITEMILFGSSPPTRSTTKAKTGSYSIRLAGNDSPWGIGIPTTASLRTGLYLNHNGLLSGDATIIRIHETLTSSWPVELVWMKDELRWDLYINGVIQDQVPTVDIGFDILDHWFHIGLISDKASFASVYLDGIKVLTYSGVIAGANWDAIAYGHKRQSNAWKAYAYFDDVYVDSLVGESDAAPPAYQFFPTYANAAGSNTGFTPAPAVANHLNVDDGAIDDSDTTINRVTTSAASLKDTHNVGDIVLPADFIIKAVHPWVVARKLNAADDAQVFPILFDGLNYGKGGAAIPAPIWWSYLHERFELQPDGSAWNETDFNNMEAGYEAGGSF